jgi:hypothetical protein
MLRRVLATVAVLSLSAGCGHDAASPTVARPVAPPAVAAAAKPVSATESKPAPTAAPGKKSKPAAPLAEAADPAKEQAPEDKPDVDSQQEAADNEAAGARERIAVLTPGGPLLIDVTLTIDGRPHTEGFEKLLKQILAAGDVNKDGKPTWTELVENEKFLKSELASAGQVNSYQARMWIETYDVNRDNRIQESEAKSWLGRDASAGADAFAVRSEKSFAPQPSASSSVWQFLDVDHNGRLSPEETRGAAESLLSLDADDDRVLTTRELASLRDQLVAADPQAANRLRGARRYAAIHLDADQDAERVHYLLEDAYAPRQQFGPKSFPAFPKLFDELDADGDRWLQQQEMAKIFSVDAHLELAVAFQDGSAKSPATVSVVRSSPEVTAVGATAPDRVVLSGGGARLVISAHDLGGAGGGYQAMGAGQVAGRRQIRLMVHDQNDALFETLDENGDARLGEREMAKSGEKMKSRDADGDGQIGEDELPYSMVIAFLRSEPARQDAFYVPPSSAPAAVDAKPPTWFVRADLNGDGDVSRREFLGDREQFSRLDANGDGYLGGVEIIASSSEENRAG